MKKVFNKIFTLILSVISLGTFLTALSIFASYYIDAFGYAYHSDKVVYDAYVFGIIAVLLIVFVLTLIILAIFSKNKRTGIVSKFILVAIFILSICAFLVGFSMLLANGSNGCSYTEDIENYVNSDNDDFRISYFPEEITDQMTVVQYSYYQKNIDTHNHDIYLEVKFIDVETMEQHLLIAKEAFSDGGYIEYQNPYDSSFTDIIKNTWVLESISEGKFASLIQFKGHEEYKYVNMIYRSISYSYEELTIIYNYTDIGNDIEIGHDPDHGKFYPKYLERFGVQHDPKNNFEYRYSEN